MDLHTENEMETALYGGYVGKKIRLCRFSKHPIPYNKDPIALRI